MKALTYDDWKLAGYHVRKGEHATGRNDKGEATFTHDQVDEDDYDCMIDIVDDDWGDK